MSTIQIHAVFAWPKYAEGPELMVAWDEFVVDANPKGYREERARAIAAYGDELDPAMIRDVTLNVDYDRIMAMFLPPNDIEAEVQV